MADDRDRARLHHIIEQQPDTGAEGVVEWLTRLCRAVASEVDAVAVTIVLGPPGEASAVIAASQPAGRHLSEIEFGVGEGPAGDAWIRRRPVLVRQLDDVARSWPGYVAAASPAGIRSVFAFPLQMGGVRLGVLTVFGDRPVALTGDGLSTCLRMAELATQRLIHDGIGADDSVDPGLDAALGFRSEIYQAQGMVAVALGVSLVDSLAMMRGHAFRAGRDLIEIANQIVHHGLRLGDTAYDRPDDDPDSKD